MSCGKFIYFRITFYLIYLINRIF